MFLYMPNNNNNCNFFKDDFPEITKMQRYKKCCFVEQWMLVTVGLGER